MTDNKTAGQLIRKRRKQNNLSIEKLAEYCNQSNRNISDIERGVRVPKASTLLEICDVLDIDVGELEGLYTRIDNEE